MAMPDEVIFQLAELYVLAVEFADNVWRPKLFKQRKFFCDVYGFDAVHGRKLVNAEQYMRSEVEMHASPSAAV